MEYGESANIAKSRGLSMQGALFGFVLAFLSTLSLRFGLIDTSLLLVPLIAVFMWPRGSSRGLSSIFIFAIGLIVDIVSAGPPGLWAFIYLSLYGIFQPDQRSGAPSIKILWPQFLGWIVVAVFFALVAGNLFIEGRTSVFALLLMAVTAGILFPIFYGIRQGLRQLVSDPDDPGYAR